MKSDLLMLQELGETRKPPADQPPADLRRRVLTGAFSGRDRPRLLPRLANLRLLPRGGGLRLVWRLGALGGAAAAVTAVLVAGQTAQVADKAPPAGTTTAPARSAGTGVDDAGQILRLAAQHSAAAPEPKARPNQFVFVESVDVDLQLRVRGKTATGQKVVEVKPTEPRLVTRWLSVDGTRDGLERFRPYRSTGKDWQGGGALPGCRDGRQVTTVDRPAKKQACTPKPAYRPDLPTDADAMLRYLYRNTDDADFSPQMSADQRAFMRIDQVIRASHLSPAVQAAVFEAAGRIPGVTVIQGVADVAGRAGVAVARTDDGTRVELIFDRTTYRYLGANVVIDRAITGPAGYVIRGLQPGDVWGKEAILRVAIVDKVGQLP